MNGIKTSPQSAVAAERTFIREEAGTLPILQVENVTKRYPGVLALDHVSFQVSEGEIRGLIGENGAGKSTIIKSIAGAIPFDSGKVTIHGESYSSITPTEAINKGISVIYQEFNLVPSMTVAENVFLGERIGGRRVVDFEEINRRTKEIFERFGVEIDPQAQVGTLSTAQMQLVEIAKAISKNVKVLFMDEPSASLSMAETEVMFEIVRTLKKQGLAIIYVSHRLDELFEICDTVTVMRDGQVVATEKTSDIDRKGLIKMMVGRELNESYPERKPVSDEVVLELEHVYGNGDVDISFQLHKGEILGLGGLVGCGRTELAKMIYGAVPVERGQIRLKGKPVRFSSPSEAIEQGIGLIPEDRKLEGVFIDFPIDWNIVIQCIRKISRMGVVDMEKAQATSAKYISDLKIVTPGSGQLVKNLSGGNQQKVVIGKVLATNTEIIIFDEPTRGIDVGAKQEIYRLMNELTEQGISIIMISSDMEELLGMSDRILVLSEGRITGELGKNEFSQVSVMELASAN